MPRRSTPRVRASAKRIPGPRSQALAARLRRVESRNITFVANDFPVFWSSARGSRVRDVDGNEFLDLTSAFSVASLGHRHPSIARAAKRQIDRLWHGMGDVHPSEIKVELLERLAELAPGDLSVSILSSSGAEAIESALKTARLATGKPGVLFFQGGYHGLSYGALSVCDRPDFRNPFADQVAPISRSVPFPDSVRGPSDEEILDRVTRAIDEGAPAGPIGAILIEPMQGRGGVRIPRPSFLRELRNIASRQGLVFIVDEIFTGFGRTGRMFGLEHSGVVPDLMCVGKALSNGFPISACIGTPSIMESWSPSDGEAIHTSTFIGHPLGCAAAVASIDETTRKKLPARAEALGRAWVRSLEQTIGSHPAVAEVRGAGLMIGIELVEDTRSLRPNPRLASQIVVKALQRGLLLLSSGVDRNVLSLTPPLTISQGDLSQATHILKEIFDGTNSD